MNNSIKITLVTTCLGFCSLTFAQDLVEVTDQKIKIGATKQEELYFGFEEGDKVIFNFKEVNDRELKELEIAEYPNNSKFSDFKTSKVENKTFNVTKKSVYVFRLRNSALTGGVCSIHIQRVPKDESTRNFNSAVSWILKPDTSWNTYTRDVVTGYDTGYVQKTKKELINSEQREELIIDKTERVHSTTNEYGNRSSIFFTLPPNQYYGNTIKRVISWAYWVGVGNEANAAWKQNSKVISSLAKSTASYFTSPLGALAVGAAAQLLTPKVGDNVYYAVTDRSGSQLFMRGQTFNAWDNGNGVAGYKTFSHPTLCQGTYYICLSNDNTLQGIDANIKVIAIIETSVYEDKPYTETVIKERHEKQIMKDPIVTNKRIPVVES
jgi:hypothetical protein